MYLTVFLHHFSWHHTYPIIERKLFAVSKYQVVNGFIFTNHSLFEPSVTKGYGSVLIIFYQFQPKKMISVRSEFIHWALWRTLMKTECFSSFTTPQSFWQSSAPCALRTLVTSVFLYSLTRAALMSLGKAEIRVYLSLSPCHSLSLSLSLYIYI